jgi:hypothetical protein
LATEFKELLVLPEKENIKSYGKAGWLFKEISTIKNKPSNVH